jgi:hypothetical protein
VSRHRPDLEEYWLAPQRIIPAKSRLTPGAALAQHGHERRATAQEDHHQQMPRICLGRLPEERLSQQCFAVYRLLRCRAAWSDDA